MIVDAVSDTPLMTPFDAVKHCWQNNGILGNIESETDCNAVTGGQWAYTNVTANSMPDIYNYDLATNQTSGALIGTVTGNQTGNSGAILDPFIDAVTYPLALGQGIINFLTGGFIWQSLNIIGLPAVFVVVLQSVIGLLLVRTIIYYVLGR
jgi:hypothetical protein